jgi:arylsulfatase
MLVANMVYTHGIEVSIVHSSDLYADFGLRFIDEAISEEKPFFLYLAFNAPHFPLQAPKETIDKYKGKFDEGWDKMRKPVYDKQLAMGLIDEKWPISPKNEDVPDWDKLTPEVKVRMAHIQEIYAACVDRMDVAVGTLVEGLKKREELENTIIVFMSDNGACAEYGPYGRYDGPEKSGTANSWVYQGQSWATYSNTPFRRYKHFTTEGGISTPCIVHWPKGLAENMKGSIVHQYGHIIDMMPTFLEIAEATYPVSYKQNEIKPLEGLSILPVLKGEDFAREAPIYWEHEGNRGGRSGKWKIVSFNHKPWTLYDLENDRTEQLDLANEHPEILEKLSTGWDAWAKRCNVEPWPEKRNSCGEPFKWAAEKYQIK